MVRKLISGGQTGADRAALDAAIALGMEYGGWVPRGRAAEDGPIPAEYSNLVETETEEPRVRTERNVRDSDATVLFTRGDPTGGSALTLRVARRLEKPILHLDLAAISASTAVRRLARWLESLRPEMLNVAGSRGSKDPEIYERTRSILESVLPGPDAP